MKRPRRWRSPIGGGLALILATGVAVAQEDSSSQSPPAATGGVTGSNFPAASAATTSDSKSGARRAAQPRVSQSASPGEPDPEAEGPTPPRGAVPPIGAVPPEGVVPSEGWHMGAKGTLIQLEELAPVEIIDLQERLKALNLYFGELDGVPGPQTRQALQQYFIKQAQLALQGQLDASALNLFDVVPTAQTEAPDSDSPPARL